LIYFTFYGFFGSVLAGHTFLQMCQFFQIFHLTYITFYNIPPNDPKEFSGTCYNIIYFMSNFICLSLLSLLVGFAKGFSSLLVFSKNQLFVTPPPLQAVQQAGPHPSPFIL
jgi:hypothetical protein